jgi:DNA repair ATPase RecN
VSINKQDYAEEFEDKSHELTSLTQLLTDDNNSSKVLEPPHTAFTREMAIHSTRGQSHLMLARICEEEDHLLDIIAAAKMELEVLQTESNKLKAEQTRLKKLDQIRRETLKEIDGLVAENASIAAENEKLKNERTLTSRPSSASAHSGSSFFLSQLQTKHEKRARDDSDEESLPNTPQTGPPTKKRLLEI